jgi:phosphatidate cytidylyltransferase
VILLIVTGVVLFAAPESLFVAASWLLCLLGIYELTKMYHFDIINQLGLMAVISLMLFMLYFANYDSSQLVRIGAILTWCFIVPILLVWQPKKFSKTTISCLAVMVFIPAFYALVVLHGLFGPLQLISLMAIAWIADIGAYFVGRRFGKRKLAPSISPGKSVEGAVGGLVLVVIYLLLLKWFNLAIYLTSYAAVFKFALILTSVSIAGDLFESWLKRVAKVKDSGSILPGHGGILDRIDSLIAVLAIAFAMIRGFI